MSAIEISKKEFKELYRKHTNRELAKIFNVSESTISIKAKSIGLNRGITKLKIK